MKVKGESRLNNNSRRWYQASEFAELAGVTVRTLHHYDRLGLLKPSGRTSSGYRLYAERDFAQLQQIVTLKFIGFSLKQIKNILDRDTFDLPTALRIQREVIEEKRRRLELASRAIFKAERMLATSDEPDWEAFAKIVEVINMQNDWEFTKKYYSEEARKKIDERANQMGAESIEQGQRDWAALIQEVETAVREGVDPASNRAQALAARWSALIEGFTGGDPEIAKGLRNLYADQANWPATAQKPYSDEAGAFICRAIEARREKAGE
ncbi:MAG TPA: MerR family transcriptional regulator [Blastocatellia bacterium]|nr:MerR family transcriptional regulator [Blastocatellia bacterium]